MPTYQYACKDCGHQFETVQSFSDASLTVCPECGGTLRKQFGAVGVIFKGSGFYRNDSRSAAKSSVNASNAKSAEKSESKTPAAKDSSSGSASSAGSGSTGSGSNNSASSASSASSSSGSTKASAPAS